MNIIKQLSVFLLLSHVITSNSQVLTNYGSEIVINEEAKIVVIGDFQNLEDGNIQNSGSIYITGDWINNATTGNLLQNTMGSVDFFGTEVQHISGIQKTWFNNLTLNNDVELETEISVSSVLNFSFGFLNLSDHNLLMENESEITNYSNTAYLIAENSGQLKQIVENENLEFPVGSVSSYLPVVLKNSGITDTFGISVFNDVLENGLTGNTIAEIDHCVNNTWNITEQVPGGSDLSITASWYESSEGISFNRYNCGIGHYTNSDWDPQVDTTSTGTNPYSITRNGITSLSAFAVGDTASPMAITLRLTLDLALFLEGPFNGTDMNADLNPDEIPLAQPYNIPPWNYMGPESTIELPNSEIVDWILVELRDTTEATLATAETMIFQQAAFILKDGKVVGMDGSTDLKFDNLVSNQLFVVVWHRNHLGIMTATPLTEVDNIYSYNFTTASGMAYLNGQKSLGDVYAMFAGDANGNGEIDLDDRDVYWEIQAGESGYHSADFNLDSQVDNIDKDDKWLNNVGVFSKVPE